MPFQEVYSYNRKQGRYTAKTNYAVNRPNTGLRGICHYLTDVPFLKLSFSSPDPSALRNSILQGQYLHIDCEAMSSFKMLGRSFVADCGTSRCLSAFLSCFAVDKLDIMTKRHKYLLGDRSLL